MESDIQAKSVEQVPINLVNGDFEEPSIGGIQLVDQAVVPGWNLTVKQDTQLKTAQNEEVKGAQLTLSKGTLQTNSDDTATVSNGVLIPGGVSIKVLEATTGQGNGTFYANWAPEGATLEVPGTSVKLAKHYTANLTWTLTDAPAP